MQIVIRTTRQAGAAIRRIRRHKALTQSTLGRRVHVRQATISRLEAGRPATQLRVLMDALAALDMELTIRPRRSATPEQIARLFG
jgi:HTH-type transcriptional regulator/antitoxin HipB